MSERRARAPAWGLWGLTLAVAFAGGMVNGLRGETTDALLVLMLVPFATVGAVLGARRPGNAIGWLLLAAAGAFAVDDLLTASAEAADGTGTPADVALWLSEWLFFVWIGLVAVFVPLLFPSGRLPSRRWRPLAWLGAAVCALVIVTTALGSDEFERDDGAMVPNPFALPGAAGDALAGAGEVGEALLGLVAVGALLGIAVRLRAARGVERQQLKWVATAIAVTLGGLVLALLSLLGEEEDAIVAAGAVGWSMFLGGFLLAVPLAIGLAILRHRLYDIDVVINRALVYGALTAILAAAYVGSVLLLGLALGPLTERSDLAVALSTLGVAALFRPARRRVQGAVDRRFYRRRYDAGRTLEGFGARLRAQTDLEALRSELTGVVRETMQPAHVSLWLRPRETR